MIIDTMILYVINNNKPAGYGVRTQVITPRLVLGAQPYGWPIEVWGILLRQEARRLVRPFRDQISIHLC